MVYWVRVVAFVLCLWAMPLGAQGSLDVVNWAPTSGSGALWFDSLGGLKAAVGMINANNGISGRNLTVSSLNIDEMSPNFLSTLDARLTKPEVVGVVGGPTQVKAEEVADHLRRLNLPWLGPWSNERAMYRGEASDPFAVLPPWSYEITALLQYVQAMHDAEPDRRGPVFLVYYNFPADQNMAAQARRNAEAMGLDLRRAPVNPDFADWPYLAEHVGSASAVIIWLAPGQSAAFARAVRSKNARTVFLTSSLNATNRNLVLLSNGAWNGTIFPAVVTPSREIPEAYNALIRKYGPVGLEGNYQSYLGFAQGRLLARALNLGLESGSMDLRQSLYKVNDFQTLFATPANYKPSRHAGGELFYLGRAYGDGFWEKAPMPYVIKEKY